MGIEIENGILVSERSICRFPSAVRELLPKYPKTSAKGTYSYFDRATFLKVREGGLLQSMVFVIVIGVRNTGSVNIGFDIGTSEDGTRFGSHSSAV